MDTYYFKSVIHITNCKYKQPRIYSKLRIQRYTPFPRQPYCTICGWYIANACRYTHMLEGSVRKNQSAVKISLLDQFLHPNLSSIANFALLVKM